MSDKNLRQQTLIQCDFDGTVTEEDISFLLLDTFATGDWRQLLEEYRAGDMSVGKFNREAFAMIKADKQSLLKTVKDQVRIRTGFNDLVSYCRSEEFRFVIVSNGLDFYIEHILNDLRLQDIETFAAQTQFLTEGLHVQYIGPGGKILDEGFKESYVNSFLNSGYRIVYIGDGIADFQPAKQCQHIFATGTLLTTCQESNIDCIGFTDLNEVVRGLELLR